jgi:nucleoside 2-deoxyribosyltransferase
MIYLASPYTHPDPVVRVRRFRATCHTAALLIRTGHVVFAPIAHSHPMTEFGLPADWEFWERYDIEFLRRSSELVVLKLDGWRESRGVQAEIDLALEMDLPIRYLDSTLADEATEAIA